MNGYVMLSLFLIILFGGIMLLILIKSPFAILAIFTALFMVPGFVLVNPNSSRVLLLFGKYVGTIKKMAFFG